jgi:hypothetical protein
VDPVVLYRLDCIRDLQQFTGCGFLVGGKSIEDEAVKERASLSAFQRDGHGNSGDKSDPTKRAWSNSVVGRR